MTWFDQQSNSDTLRTGRPLALAAVVLLAGTVVAGCSDDDESGSTQAETTETESTSTTASDQGQASAPSVAVDIVDIEQGFEPSAATVTAGGEVTWTNSDDIPHTATAEDGTWDSGNLEPGAEFTFAGEEPGTYPYICDIHPTMKGELIVE